ncbi:hypothetical protein BIV25_43170 [Streptomyces sp. MUSC 14]|nr:hypothetical protein BIV25_43170 [Streptomyces sp. MUSC 14]
MSWAGRSRDGSAVEAQRLACSDYIATLAAVGEETVAAVSTAVRGWSMSALPTAPSKGAWWPRSGRCLGWWMSLEQMARDLFV